MVGPTGSRRHAPGNDLLSMSLVRFPSQLASHGRYLGPRTNFKCHAFGHWTNSANWVARINFCCTVRPRALR